MSNRITKIEAWALNVVARIQAAEKVEDARLELKREWPDPVKAARRIAGHANSSFGSDILWIVGLDEVSGVVGVQPQDLANWWPAVCSHFDGVAPSMTDIMMPVDGTTLVCLLLETNRPPYVVKNPVFGSPGGGSVASEVPWRDGTSVRTATRNDLVRMLVPTVAQPEVEVLGGSGRLTVKKEDFPGDTVIGFRLAFSISVYIYPRNEGAVVIPFHKCQCVLAESTGSNSIDEFEFTMYRPHLYHPRGGRPDTVTLERTSSELIAHGPGKCSIDVDMALETEPEWLQRELLQLRVILYVIDSELPVEVGVSLKQDKPSTDTIRCWSIAARG